MRAAIWISYLVPGMVSCFWILSAASPTATFAGKGSGRSMNEKSVAPGRMLDSTNRIATSYPQLTHILADPNRAGMSVRAFGMLTRVNRLIDSYRNDPSSFFTTLEQALESNLGDATLVVRNIAVYCGVPQMAFDWAKRHPGQDAMFLQIAYLADPEAFVSEFPPQWSHARAANEFVFDTMPRRAPPPEMTETDPASAAIPLSQGLKIFLDKGLLTKGAISLIPPALLRELDPSLKQEIGKFLASELEQAPDSQAFKVTSRFLETLDAANLQQLVADTKKAGGLAGPLILSTALASGKLPLETALALPGGAEAVASLGNIKEVIRQIPEFDTGQSGAWIALAAQSPEILPDLVSSLAGKSTDPASAYAGLLQLPAMEGSPSPATQFAEALIQSNPLIASVAIRDVLDRGAAVSNSVLARLADSQAGYDNAGARAWAERIPEPAERARVLKSIPE